jgi:hypothetical protein
MLRYQFGNNTVSNGGVGQFALSSQAVNTSAANQALQASDTQIIDARTLNQIRFQYIRTRDTETAVSSAPTVSVEGAFTGGGSNSGAAQNHVDQYEVQDYFLKSFSKHTLKLGGRLRAAHYASNTTAGFNGSFVFSSLNAYALTEHGLSKGLSPQQIRTMGGGADQFSISSGSPALALAFADLGLYAEDDWKIRKNILLSYGLRYETQSAIADHHDLAPRVGIAWGIGHKRKTVIRAGYGWFYDRFAAGNVLHAEQLNGINQQPFVVNDPDFFPNIPSIAALSAQAAPSLYRISLHLRAPYAMEAGVSIDQALSKSVMLSLSYFIPEVSISCSAAISMRLFQGPTTLKTRRAALGRTVAPRTSMNTNRRGFSIRTT